MRGVDGGLLPSTRAVAMRWKVRGRLACAFDTWIDRGVVHGAGNVRSRRVWNGSARLTRLMISTILPAQGVRSV